MVNKLDLAALRRPETMVSVLEYYAEPRGMRSGKLYYTCPLHDHKHPGNGHLRIDIGRNGEAVAICDREGPIGDVFSLYGQLAGVNGFKEQVQGCSELAGYRMRESKAGFSPRRSRTPHPAPHAAPDIAPEPAYLTDSQEGEALQAVERAYHHEEVLKQHASRLGLPIHALRPYPFVNDLIRPLGLLGLDEQNRLLYIYTKKDGLGNWRIPAVKVRMPEGSTPRFVCWKGSNKQNLWGAESIVSPQIVIITEGESDALAVRYSLNFSINRAFAGGWKSTGPLNFPSVVAKPDAGTFKASWASSLRGCDVILLVDNDAAGRAGADKTAEILHHGGVRRVSSWLPPDGCKDARSAFDMKEPDSLARDILEKSKLIKK